MKIFVVALETDAVREVRQIYTIWDVLGDIGGLSDMLQLICWPIITLFHLLLGNGINLTLLQHLFKVQKKVDSTDVISQIRQRKSLKIKLCNWLLNRKKKLKFEKAQIIIDQELDVLQFLKNQFAMQTVIKLLFTKVERYLLFN